MNLRNYFDTIPETMIRTSKGKEQTDVLLFYYYEFPLIQITLVTRQYLFSSTHSWKKETDVCIQTKALFCFWHRWFYFSPKHLNGRINEVRASIKQSLLRGLWHVPPDREFPGSRQNLKANLDVPRQSDIVRSTHSRQLASVVGQRASRSGIVRRRSVSNQGSDYRESNALHTEEGVDDWVNDGNDVLDVNNGLLCE